MYLAVQAIHNIAPRLRGICSTLYWVLWHTLYMHTWNCKVWWASRSLQPTTANFDLGLSGLASFPHVTFNVGSLGLLRTPKREICTCREDMRTHSLYCTCAQNYKYAWHKNDIMHAMIPDTKLNVSKYTRVPFPLKEEVVHNNIYNSLLLTFKFSSALTVTCTSGVVDEPCWGTSFPAEAQHELHSGYCQ